MDPRGQNNIFFPVLQLLGGKQSRGGLQPRWPDLTLQQTSWRLKIRNPNIQSPKEKGQEMFTVTKVLFPLQRWAVGVSWAQVIALSLALGSAALELLLQCGCTTELFLVVSVLESQQPFQGSDISEIFMLLGRRTMRAKHTRRKARVCIKEKKRR